MSLLKLRHQSSLERPSAEPDQSAQPGEQTDQAPASQVHLQHTAHVVLQPMSDIKLVQPKVSVRPAVAQAPNAQPAMSVPKPQPDATKPNSDKPSPSSDVADDNGPPPEKVKDKRTKKRTFGGISRDTSEYIVESLSMMLLAGVTVGEAIESIAAEIPKKPIRDILQTMRNSIDEGKPFALALEQTGLFDLSVITLIEVGESTGKLPENLRVVAAQMHKNNTMNSKIRSAMLYPAFLVTLLFVVGTGIGVFLLPKLLTVITGLQIKVGLMTRILIVVGTLFGKFGLIFAAVVVVVVITTSILIKKSSTARAASEAVLYRIPGIKKLLFETEISRFGFVLGTLLDAGLPVVTALQSLSASMSTRRYQRFTEEVRQRVDEGDSFNKILSDKKYRKLVPGTITQIVVSAERSGNLANSLLKVGSNFEDKADITARNLETLLEPIVLVLIAAAVLFVAMAVFLPIYSLVGNLNGA